MSRKQRIRDYLAGGSSGGGEPPKLKPRPPQWLIDRVLESCNGDPGVMLSDWLASRQVYPDDVIAWRAATDEAKEQRAASWRNPSVVRNSIASLEGHPLRAHLGSMLRAALQCHAPQNLHLLPPEFQEPK